MKKLIITFVLLTSSITVFSQNNVIKAFSVSYKHEYKKEYQKAIDAMLKVDNPIKYSSNLRLGWLYYLNGAGTVSIWNLLVTTVTDDFVWVFLQTWSRFTPRPVSLPVLRCYLGQTVFFDYTGPSRQASLQEWLDTLVSSNLHKLVALLHMMGFPQFVRIQ